VYVKTTPYVAVINYPVNGLLSATVGVDNRQAFPERCETRPFTVCKQLIKEL